MGYCPWAIRTFCRKKYYNDWKLANEKMSYWTRNSSQCSVQHTVQIQSVGQTSLGCMLSLVFVGLRLGHAEDVNKVEYNGTKERLEDLQFADICLMSHNWTEMQGIKIEYSCSHIVEEVDAFVYLGSYITNSQYRREKPALHRFWETINYISSRPTLSSAAIRVWDLEGSAHFRAKHSSRREQIPEAQSKISLAKNHHRWNICSVMKSL